MRHAGSPQLYAESAVRAVDEEKAARPSRPPSSRRPRVTGSTSSARPFAGRGQRPDPHHAQGLGVDSRRANRHLRVHAPRARTGRSSRPRTRSGRAARPVRLPDRREAEGPAARRLGDPALAARDRVPLRRRRRGRARLLPHAQDHRAGARPLGRGRRGLERATTASRCRASPAAARSATSPTASAR